MKHIIEVDCETIDQLQAHLTVLKDQIRKRAKKEKLNMAKEAFPISTFIIDDNCYGSHSMHVYED
jgi:hypothetical protein